MRRLGEVRLTPGRRPSLKLRYVCGASPRLEPQSVAPRTAGRTASLGLRRRRDPDRVRDVGRLERARPLRVRGRAGDGTAQVADLGREDGRTDRARDQRVDRVVVEPGQHAAVADAGCRLLGIHVQVGQLRQRDRLTRCPATASSARSGSIQASPSAAAPHQIASTSTNDLPRISSGKNGSGGNCMIRPTDVISSGTVAVQSRHARSTSRARSTGNQRMPA